MTVATFYATQDAHFSTGADNGASVAGAMAGSVTSTFSVGYTSGCSAAFYVRGLMMFDLSALTGAIDVTAASLNYYINSTSLSADYVNARRVLSTWAETDATDSPAYTMTGTAPLDFSSTGYKSSSDPKFLEWARGWIDGTFASYGIVLVPINTDAQELATIRSHEYSAYQNDPYLSVTYNTKVTLTSPADQAAVDLSTQSYAWSVPGTQTSYALRRRAWDSTVYEWWDAGGSSWVTTETFNTSSTESATPTWSDPDATYYWAVAANSSVTNPNAVTTLTPNGATLNAWTQLGTASPAHAGLSDSLDTTGFTISNTLSSQLVLDMATASLSTITSVTVRARVKFGTTTDGNTLRVYHKLPSQTDDAVGTIASDDLSNVATWVTLQRRTTRPDGAAWTQTDLDNLQIGFTRINGTNSTWQVLEVAVDVESASGSVTQLFPYSDEQLVNPYEWWDGSSWVSTETWISQSSPDLALSGTSFTIGNYQWSAAVKDQQGVAGAYAAPYDLIIGSLFERWGATFI